MKTDFVRGSLLGYHQGRSLHSLRHLLQQVDLKGVGLTAPLQAPLLFLRHRQPVGLEEMADRVNLAHLPLHHQVEVQEGAEEMAALVHCPLLPLLLLVVPEERGWSLGLLQLPLSYLVELAKEMAHLLVHHRR